MRLVFKLFAVAALTSSVAFAAPKKAAKPAADEVNAIALLSGARQIDEDGLVQLSAVGLHDGDVTTAGQWEPAREMTTISTILQLAEPFDLQRAEAVNSNNEEASAGLSTQELLVDHGATPKGPWLPLGRVSLKQGTQVQPFKLEPTKAVRYVRVTLLSNHGNEQWWGLGELSIFGRRSTPREVRFNGAWSTNYGEMQLTQNGSRITGCYGAVEAKAGNTTVEGTLEGAVFSGTYTELGGGTPVHGFMVFVLTQEGELSGVWGAAANERNQRWDGTPLPKSTITCDKPEASMERDLEDGRVVLRGILFDTGKDTIRPESIAVLEELARIIRKREGKRFVVEGHTDDRGTPAANLTLSGKRAAAVKTWLTAHEVPAAQLDIKGHGQTKPTMANDSEAGRAANRRVEVALIEQAGK